MIHALKCGLTSPLQQAASRLASQAYQLTCELATDREDFGTAKQTGQQAFAYAQLAGDANLQVAALISLANLEFHLSSANPDLIRKYSKDALQVYTHAVSLLSEHVTPLLKGRTYAGIAEVYAMRTNRRQSSDLTKFMHSGLAWSPLPFSATGCTDQIASSRRFPGPCTSSRP